MTHYSRSRENTWQIMTRGFALLLFCLFPLIANAGDPAMGKTKVVACVPCHGANGISTHSTWPNLLGQDALYLVSQLKAFRDGTRKSEMMYPMAFDLSDKDIDDIAAYYNKLKCE